MIIKNGITLNMIETKIMTITTKMSGTVKIYMAGTGTFTVDWGDGTETETYGLLHFDEDLKYLNRRDKFVYSHYYNDASSRTITITCKNITHFCCDGNQLKRLDVSNNTELIWLICNNNQLTSLDVTNNTALTALFCQNNQLISLDLNNNKELVWLNCSQNHLKKLDVSKNILLIKLFCFDNKFSKLNVSKNKSLKHLKCNNNQTKSSGDNKNTERKTSKIAFVCLSFFLSICLLCCFFFLENVSWFNYILIINTPLAITFTFMEFLKNKKKIINDTYSNNMIWILIYPILAAIIICNGFSGFGGTLLACFVTFFILFFIFSFLKSVLLSLIKKK